MKGKPKSSRKPVAVLTSDVHYSLSTLQLADKAFQMAIDKAAELGVPLIDAGDLTNDKAILRAEVVNALIDTMEYAARVGVEVTLLVGNHSLCNEKGSEHALHFLEPYATVVSAPVEYRGLYLIPYQPSPEAFQDALAPVPHGSQLIIHQGVRDANPGHYIQDHSAVEPHVLQPYRSVGGHYHTRQSIGTHTFIGNPYTLTFAEANDPDKGFQVLFDDGTLELIRTGLRKHVIIETSTAELDEASLVGADPFQRPEPTDLVWLKVTGTRLELEALSKPALAKSLGMSSNFKLDLIPTDQKVGHMTQKEGQTDSDLMDELIDRSQENEQQKEALKALYRKVLA